VQPQHFARTPGPWEDTALVRGCVALAPAPRRSHRRSPAAVKAQHRSSAPPPSVIVSPLSDRSSGEATTAAIAFGVRFSPSRSRVRRATRRSCGARQRCCVGWTAPSEHRAARRWSRTGRGCPPRDFRRSCGFRRTRQREPLGRCVVTRFVVRQPSEWIRPRMNWPGWRPTISCCQGSSAISRPCLRPSPCCGKACRQSLLELWTITVMRAADLDRRSGATPVPDRTTGTPLIAATSRSESPHPRSSRTALVTSSLRRTPTIVEIAPDAAKRGTQESNLALRFWRPPC
jgi:hypothetical protein